MEIILRRPNVVNGESVDVGHVGKLKRIKKGKIAVEFDMAYRRPSK